jgi:hypothetical protein
VSNPRRIINQQKTNVTPENQKKREPEFRLPWLKLCLEVIGDTEAHSAGQLPSERFAVPGTQRYWWNGAVVAINPLLDAVPAHEGRV